MSLKKEPFRSYTLDEENKEKPDVFTIRLNAEEREVLNKCKRLIEQPKDGTALKTLAWIGAKVIHDEKTLYLIETLFKNKRNNERSGISIIE